MKFWEEVVERDKIPNDDKKKIKYNADRLTGAAVTHVYDRMIREGLAFACLTNGYCKVFFHVPKKKPKTLYYFLSEPNMDVQSADDETWLRQPITSVGRMLSFCLMSARFTPRSQELRHKASDRVRKWAMDFDHTLGQMSQSEVHSTPPGSEYNPSTYSVTPPAIKTRQYDLRSRSRTSADSSDSDSNDAPSGPSNASGRKRNLSQLSSLSEQERNHGRLIRGENIVLIVRACGIKGFWTFAVQCTDTSMWPEN
ncbi:hypothetical protein V1517DRAFT_327706 [Lipomyces orientalis]|uniref:Uncharacterized protein n=1 Tax=Lipomyces orientalis TaxID=1233043 RepID=A0ACC3TJB4_9ASCO